MKKIFSFAALGVITFLLFACGADVYARGRGGDDRESIDEDQAISDDAGYSPDAGGAASVDAGEKEYIAKEAAKDTYVAVDGAGQSSSDGN